MLHIKYWRRGNRLQRSLGWLLALISIASLVILLQLLNHRTAPSAAHLAPTAPTAVIANPAAQGLNEGAITPLPESLNLNPQQVSLGQRLFHETQLSRNRKMACASCHILQRGGTDGLPQSIGQNGQPIAMNAPTVLNSAFNFRQFWDGRSLSLEDQVNHPLAATDELNLTWKEVIQRLQSDKTYVVQFRQSYPSGLNPDTVRHAIATFQRSLITPSRFDQFLRGDAQALTPAEKRGYQKFQDYGCTACHQGVNLGGNMFQTFGIIRNYYPDNGVLSSTNQGRMNITGDPSDQYVFRVPSLRNVALTAPYFHDGHVETLPQVVRIMAEYQLGRTMPETDVSAIVAFLQSLTGELPPSVKEFLQTAVGPQADNSGVLAVGQMSLNQTVMGRETP